MRQSAGHYAVEESWEPGRNGAVWIDTGSPRVNGEPFLTLDEAIEWCNSTHLLNPHYSHRVIRVERTEMHSRENPLGD